VTGGILRALPALAWAGLIWGSSSTPGDGTSWLTWAWLDLPFLDKVAHALLFGVLAALLRYAGASAPAAVLTAVAWGVIDEVHQAFVPGRSPELADLAADAVGATLSVLVVRSVASRRRRPR
jgi:VanZ family protein